jgi:hypothetical protein
MARLSRLAHFLFWSPKRGSLRVQIVVAALFLCTGVAAVAGLYGGAAIGWIWLLGGVGYSAQAAYMYVDRRKNPDPRDPEPGQVWTASDGRQLTIEGSDGDTVRCSRYDPRTGVTDVWVGSRAAFEALAEDEESRRPELSASAH